ncbi:carboxypeptidase-like regulatory domain-containing protein [Halosolutus amylolyticus]|uniref:Carboxypeptidase-like regulatory domain-containing protein n=1 Tax=Halosolutus amylolyticus TaxID=2932267 RepID=A0ABD5PKX1_9EURY|nr:carboxypeptidase-like regulatory domain-containing protein [Halosolutus amylolyticus]
MNPNRRHLLRGLAGAGLLPLAGYVTAGVDSASATEDEQAKVRSSAVSNGDSAPSLNWQWTDDAAGDAVVQDVVTTADGEVICVGQETDSGGAQHVLVRRIDRDGETVWSERIGGDGHDAAIGATTSETGDVLFCGGSASEGSTSLDTIVGRVDPDGDLAWLEPFGRSGTNDAAHAVTRADDGGVVAAGGTHYLGGAFGDGVGRLLKIDTTGSLEWEETYDDDRPGELYDVVTASRGRYAFVGTRASADGDDGRAWLGVVSDDGALEWSRTYGAAGSRIGYGLVEIDDGGFAFAGTTTPPARDDPTVWVVKVDEDGTLEWERTYGGGTSDGALSIAASPDGYSVAGWTEEGGTDRGWLLSLDAVGGLEWEEMYGSGGDARFNVHRPVGSGYAAGGYATAGGVSPSVWAIGLGDPADEPVSVSGVVTDSGGNDVSGVAVEFVDAATGEVQSTVSPDTDGEYVVDLPGNATYRVVVDDVDFERFRDELSVAANETQEFDIELTLTPFGRRKRTKRELAGTIDDASISLTEADRADTLLTELTAGVEAGDLDLETAAASVTRHLWGERIVQDANTGLGPGEYSELSDYHLIHRTARAGVKAVIQLLALPKILAKKVAAHFTTNDLVLTLVGELADLVKEAVTRALDLCFSDGEPGSDGVSPRQEAERLAEAETNAIEQALDPAEPITYGGIKQLISDAIDAVTVPVAELERLRTETIFYRPNLLELQYQINADAVAADGLPGTEEDANRQFVDGSRTVDDRLAIASEAMSAVDDGLVNDDDGILAALADVWHERDLSAVLDLIWSLIGFVEDLLSVFYDVSNLLVGTGAYYSVLAPMTTATTGIARGQLFDLTGGD